MPIYDYLCSNCGVKTEVIHGIDAPGPRFCPSCGAEGTMRKAFATPAVHFKGSGWAKKDRSSSSGARSRSSSGSASPEAGEGKSGEGKDGEGKGDSGTQKASAGGDAGGGKSSGTSSGTSSGASASSEG